MSHLPTSKFRVRVVRPPTSEGLVSYYHEKEPVVYAPYKYTAHEPTRTDYQQFQLDNGIPHCPLFQDSRYSVMQKNTTQLWAAAMQQVNCARAWGYYIGTSVVKWQYGKQLKASGQPLNWNEVGWVSQYLLWRLPNQNQHRPLLVQWGEREESEHLMSDLVIVEPASEEIIDPFSSNLPAIPTYLKWMEKHDPFSKKSHIEYID
jgi:hypothetical protein